MEKEIQKRFLSRNERPNLSKGGTDHRRLKSRLAFIKNKSLNIGKPQNRNKRIIKGYLILLKDMTRKYQ